MSRRFEASPQRANGMAFLGLVNVIALGWTVTLGNALLDAVDTCPGEIDMPGYGTVQIVAAQWNIPDDPATRVDVVDGKVFPHLSGRSYFADACQAGKYNFNDYVAMNLLGKSFLFTTDLSAAGCGCNAALYLTNLQQNQNTSGCLDYYCDANSICGVPCPEIDIMEANSLAWHSTLHAADDRFGIGGGYGGGGPGWNGARDWDSSQYGPGGTCVDTTIPFRVNASFPVDASGRLVAMTITLSQPGRPCDLHLNIGGYDGNTSKWKAGNGHGMLEMTDALRAGMTPIASFWESEEMLWMDGKGNDTKGPCKRDLAVPCPEKVPMYDFSVVSLAPFRPKGSGWEPYAMFTVAFLLLAILAICAYVMASGGAHGLLEEGTESEDSSE